MYKFFKKIKKKKGFTLVELLAVIVILGIIMLIAIPSVIDVLSSSKQKSFIEYIDKVYNIAQNKYSELGLTGDEKICTIYKVSTDFGLAETGSFDGYILIDYNKEENKYYTYITLYNDDYMILNYLYDGSVSTSDLEKYDSSDPRLDLSYLCSASTCVTCSVNDDKKDPSISCSGYGCEIKCIGSDCNDDCEGADCDTTCTGSDCSKEEESKTCTGNGCDQKCIGSSCEVICTGKDCERVISSKYILSLIANGKGELSSSSVEVGYKNNAKFSATPNKGYYLSGINCSDGYTITSAHYGVSYTDKQDIIVANSIGEDGECTANFSVKSYIVNLISNDKFKFDKDKISVAYNKSGKVNVTEVDGYILKKVDCSNDYSTIVSDSKVTVTNNSSTFDSTCSIPDDGTGYSVKSYKVKINTPSNGTVSSNSISVKFGGSSKFTITPNEGYYISSVTCSPSDKYTVTGTVGSSADSAIEYSIKNNSYADDGECSASLTKKSYTVKVDAGTNGKADKSSLSVVYNSSNSVTVTPNAGYYISGASCTNGYSISGTTGTSATSATTFTIINSGIIKDSTCSFSYKKRTYTVNISKSGSGSINTSSVNIDYGATNTFVATPSTGYYISSVTCTNGYTTNASTGTSATSAQTITISNNNYNAASTCTVNYTISSYNVSVNAGSGGSVNKSGFSVSYGSTVSFTATASTGYYVSGASCTNDYSISGSTGSSVSSSTFTVNNNSKTSSSTCSVSFGVKSFTVYLNSGGNGSWASSSKSVSYGGNVGVTITPNSRYKLNSISCTNGYSASYSSGSSSSQNIVIYNNSNASTSTCTASFGEYGFSGSKTSSSGNWIGVYTNGRITYCYYKRGYSQYCTGTTKSNTTSVCAAAKSTSCCTGSSSTKYYAYAESSGHCGVTSSKGYHGAVGGGLPDYISS